MLFRHGYYARPDKPLLDAKEFMTHSRVTGAANTTGLMTDIAITATAAHEPGAAEADLTISVKADRIVFEHAPGHHTDRSSSSCSPATTSKLSWASTGRR